MEKKLGVEIEFTGVRRIDVVRVLENFFHTIAEEVVSETTEDKYKFHRVTDSNGGVWLVVRDRSIKAEKYTDYTCNSDRFNIVEIDDTEYMCELVSPPLTSKSLPLLFSIVDIIRGIGGLTNSSCGIHVHVDRPAEINDCVLIYNRFLLEQDTILEKFKTRPERIETYCKKYDTTKPLVNFDNELDLLGYVHDFVTEIYKNNLSTDEPLKKIRYFALNMYSLLAHGTIEFRLFNSSLNRCDIAMILDWVLHFMYTAEDYNSYIPILGSILMNEMKEEV